MYSLMLLRVAHKRQWILMDTITCLPLLISLCYHIDNLSTRSLSTQSTSLQALKFFLRVLATKIWGHILL